MTDIILESGGTIDKYEGDAIIAFWNAPTNQNNHAQRAIETAIKCQKEIIKMQNEFSKFSNTKIITPIYNLLMGIISIFILL